MLSLDVEENVKVIISNDEDDQDKEELGEANKIKTVQEYLGATRMMPQVPATQAKLKIQRRILGKFFVIFDIAVWCM